MKRAQYLFEQIVTFDNLRLAWTKARRGKGFTKPVQKFSKDVNGSLEEIRHRLLSSDQCWGHYRRFKITDPKERIISAASFDERIMHHAIMNIVEPVIERQMIYHTYACRIGKGTHRAVKYAYEQCRNYPCFIKLDVRKYFDSVNHDILKSLLARIIKDGRCLLLLYGIIDSYCTVSASEKHAAKGLPIGNLTSQFFANLYLSPLDHYVLEELHASAYVRYMDDFVLWGSSRFSLCTQLRAIRTFCKERLSLTLKEPVVSSCAAGIPFLGCRITSDGIRLLQKTLRRKRRKIKLVTSLCEAGLLGEEEAAVRMTEIAGKVKV